MIDTIDEPITGDDGHRWSLIGRIPRTPRSALLWLPALGVAARHYLPFADALATRGVAVLLHEWRGHGSSSLRANHRVDWGYRELLWHDLPASESMLGTLLPSVPITLGGHSLGGQLACCRLAVSPSAASRLWLVASGSPYWRAFPARTRWWLPATYRFLPWLANWRGALPGRAVGFGGNEARGLIADWARSGVSGRYFAGDYPLDQELARIQVPVDAVVLADDWLGPPGSLRFLLSKLPGATASITRLDSRQLGIAADHFAWMTQPAAVADALLAAAGASPSLRSGEKSIPLT